MTTQDSNALPPVRQLRLVVEADDFDAAVRFYRDVLGLQEPGAYQEAGDARVSILDVGEGDARGFATPSHRRMVDELEVGRETDHVLRVAFEVDDAQQTTDRLVAEGADLIASPRETPWRSLNARMDGPAGLHITVFQELDDLEQRGLREGFGTTADREPM